MVRIEPYAPHRKDAWDRFIAGSRNGVFLFLRDYMDYHADRFHDHSLLFFLEDRLVGVLPANRDGDRLVSHAGLTFGGIVSDRSMRMPLMLEILDALKAHARAAGIGRLIYKAVPHIYHRLPAEEDLYALFVNNARLFRRDISSTIALADRIPLTKGRKYSARKGWGSGVEVRPSTDFAGFMALEEESLQKKYGVRPTHSAAEMQMLAGRLPQHIKLFAAYRQDVLLGGTIIFENPGIAHAQYIAASDEGKQLGALDCLFEVLLNETYAGWKYFDFGISTEQAGRCLNRGLIENKESYGGRGTTYDFYELDTAA